MNIIFGNPVFAAQANSARIFDVENFALAIFFPVY